MDDRQRISLCEAETDEGKEAGVDVWLSRFEAVWRSQCSRSHRPWCGRKLVEFRLQWGRESERAPAGFGMLWRGDFRLEKIVWVLV